MKHDDQVHSSDKSFLQILSSNSSVLSSMLYSDDDPRYEIASYAPDAFSTLVDKYSVLPQKTGDGIQVTNQMTKDLYVGVPRWSSPRLQYNVGTSINQAAAAAYSLALQQNIYNINDGLAGNTIIAEEAVTKILTGLAKVKGDSHGVFTFGGTATNLYGMKIGIRKANPHAHKSGVGNKLKVFITEDAHFSHATCAEWLGIGSDNVVTMKADNNRFTDLVVAEKMLRDAIEDGFTIGGIFVNGGTTYDHSIDDIEGVINIRDRLVKDYSLTYIPHVHVDSVIGWIWLFFADYNWSKNPLNIPPDTLKNVREQYERIKHINKADSWGVDFHKSIGGCPIDCSMIVVNKRVDAMLLSRKSNGTSTHQLAAEYSLRSPVEYTLETSRAAGAPLAALTALHTTGAEGYQKNLANLVEQTLFMRKQLSSHRNIQVTNMDGLGFVTILRILPQGLESVTYDSEFKNVSSTSLEKSMRISEYTKLFFNWDYTNRVKKGKPGPEFSFSSKYATLPNTADLGVVKLYPVSPLFSRHYAQETVDVIVSSVDAYARSSHEDKR